MSIQRHEEKSAPAHRRERESQIWLLYLYVYLYLGLFYANWVSQECCLFYPRSSLRSLDLLLFYFTGFSVVCPLAAAILDSFSLFYPPNTMKCGVLSWEQRDTGEELKTGALPRSLTQPNGKANSRTQIPYMLIQDNFPGHTPFLEYSQGPEPKNYDHR